MKAAIFQGKDSIVLVEDQSYAGDKHPERQKEQA
jgi:hypothetical protein